ncbi:hypothetical protein IWQ60_006437 [Tieghemiomyces parasiticus]|uniref:Uncharacterized protein n=1 Tax=Tieghemiomyces parasiticus TaxID=78921 RepID=A0A9W8A4C4_9FUNG|nr:hypothetical protein IWQ60_006437 [Tieghemiomyces parasiticus]
MTGSICLGECLTEQKSQEDPAVLYVCTKCTRRDMSNACTSSFTCRLAAQGDSDLVDMEDLLGEDTFNGIDEDGVTSLAGSAPTKSKGPRTGQALYYNLTKFQDDRWKAGLDIDGRPTPQTLELLSAKLSLASSRFGSPAASATASPHVEKDTGDGRFAEEQLVDAALRWPRIQRMPTPPHSASESGGDVGTLRQRRSSRKIEVQLQEPEQGTAQLISPAASYPDLPSTAAAAQSSTSTTVLPPAGTKPAPVTVTAKTDNPRRIRIVPVDCLSVCDRGNAIAFAAPGKYTYQFANVDHTDPEALHDIMQFAHDYIHSQDGFTKGKTRPPTLRKNITARIPPLNLPQAW